MADDLGVNNETWELRGALPLTATEQTQKIPPNDGSEINETWELRDSLSLNAIENTYDLSLNDIYEELPPNTPPAIKSAIAVFAGMQHAQQHPSCLLPDQHSAQSLGLSESTLHRISLIKEGASCEGAQKAIYFSLKELRGPIEPIAPKSGTPTKPSPKDPSLFIS